MALQKGMQVEVLFSGMQLGASSNKKYRGPWVQGVLLDTTTGICKINLKKSLTDNDNIKSLTKVKRFIRNAGNSFLEIYVGDVRPAPPPTLLSPECLKNGVAVEAWETDCWWPGFIVREISHEGHQLWLVSFPHTKILSAYPACNLRPAEEWIDGKWTLVPPAKNLNIEQVIRILSEEEVEKSNNLCDVSQGCFTNEKIQAMDNKGSPSAANESKSNPVLSSSQLKRTLLEEEIHDVRESKGEAMTVENEPETVQETDQQARRSDKISRRGRPKRTVQEPDQQARMSDKITRRGRPKRTI